MAVVPFYKPMGAQEFQERVNDYARFSRMVQYTEHSREQMEARGFTNRMVLNVLRKGGAVGNPKYNEGKASYEGVMEHVVAGKRLSVVCALRNSALIIIVITAY